MTVVSLKVKNLYNVIHTYFKAVSIIRPGCFRLLEFKKKIVLVITLRFFF
jgi:hypothetical protein